MRRKVIAGVIVVVVLGAVGVYFAWPLLRSRGGQRRAGEEPPTTATRVGPVDYSELPNLHRVTDDLYRGAQPSMKGLRELKKLAIKTVLNLRHTSSDRLNCEDVGLAYEHIDIKAWHIDRGQITAFLRIATDKDRTPVFVHCLNGADRTGCLVAAYRVVVCGWTKDEAIREMKDPKFGTEVEFRNLPARIQELDVEGIRKELGLAR
jgi:protein tyrosine/serine phosphatase